MKHLYKLCFSLSAVFIVLFFSNASTGPGLNFNTGYTGASFDNNSYCSNCHSGGSFTPAVSIQLRNGLTPVTNYAPNTSYTVHIDVTSSTGVTPATAYGFQVVAVRSSNNNNAGTWGSLTATDYHSVSISGRNYVEHNNPLVTGSIDIPWTSPGPGNGSVVFYAAGNVVDGMGGTSDDNATTNTLTIPVDPLPATWISFDGRVENSEVRLEWATTREMNKGVFILEKSADGSSFAEFAKVNAKDIDASRIDYQYADAAPGEASFYKIKFRDYSGKESTFKTIQLKSISKPTGIVYVSNGKVIVKMSSLEAQQAETIIRTLDGRVVSKTTTSLQSGINTIQIDRPAISGIYLITVHTGSKMVFSDKFLAE